MTNHVSSETGLALRDAGLKWEPQAGDWVYRNWTWPAGFCGLDQDIDPMLVTDIGVTLRAVFVVGSAEGVSMADIVWLPTTGQLVRALARFGQVRLNMAPDETWWASYSYQEDAETKRTRCFIHAEPQEALAAALLLALREAGLAALKEARS